MTGVIYARYSSDNQREESIEGQLRECRQYAEKNGIVLLEHYIDRAYSAKTDNRPSFLKMIADSAQKKFDTVIVWKLDRFARNRYDSARYKAQLRKNGVRVVSATESISEGSEGILLESVLEGMAEYYSADLAEKVIRGMTENALKCKYNGGTLLLGYTVDENHLYRVDPLVAPHILKAFEHYADGKTMQAITNDLNNAGVRTNKGAKITFNTVTRMLHNRRYVGEYRYRDTVIPGGIPAIVSEELFEKVQERMAANAHAPAHHKAEDEYLLTTKLFCGECKRMMVGESGTGKSGIIHRYYKCVGAKRNHDCHKQSVKKEWIENLVLEQIRKVIFDDELLNDTADRLLARLNEENKTLPLLRKQLREVEKGIENFMNAIQMGIITSSTKERLEALEAEKNALNLRIVQEEIANPSLTKEQILFFLEKFRKLNPSRLDHRRRLIDSFVNAVFLYDDKMLITFNCAEGTKTYTFNELEEARRRSDLEAVASPNKNTDELLRSSSVFLFANPKQESTQVAYCKKAFRLNYTRLATERSEDIPVRVPTKTNPNAFILDKGFGFSVYIGDSL